MSPARLKWDLHAENWFHDSRLVGRLAQLARAPALQAGGHWFESSTAHHNTTLAR